MMMGVGREYGYPPGVLTFHAADRDGGQVGAGFGQQVADVEFGFQISAFADVVKADDALSVDKKLVGPVAVVVGAPSLKVVIHSHRPSYAEAGQGFPHIFLFFLKVKLRGMDADHYQALGGVFVVPVPYIRQGALAVDSRVGPEVDEDDTAALVSHSQGRAVEPSGDAAEFRGGLGAGRGNDSGKWRRFRFGLGRRNCFC